MILCSDCFCLSGKCRDALFFIFLIAKVTCVHSLDLNHPIKGGVHEQIPLTVSLDVKQNPQFWDGRVAHKYLFCVSTGNVSIKSCLPFKYMMHFLRYTRIFPFLMGEDYCCGCLTFKHLTFMYGKNSYCSIKRREEKSNLQNCLFLNGNTT